MSRYVLAKSIARGGMAEIFLGKNVGDDGFQRIVAIKRILPHYAREADYIEMFRDEAHICKRLRHPNIVRVEGFEEVDGSYAIIMEYVDGSDLRSLLGTVEKDPSVRRIPVPLAVYMIAEAARGLHYAHARKDEVTHKPLNIVHRDISPQNILISYEGEVKVTDFGIADAREGFKQTETKAGIVKGKYSYMSPEQISAKDVDCRTDVFALSIVLWEMLAMKRLFHGESEVQTIELVRHCKIPYRLVDINPHADSELEAIVLKGLQREMLDRYQSADALEKELRRYLAKKYPEFGANDLAKFMQSILADKKYAIDEEIKRTLSSNAAPMTSTSSVQRLSTGEPKARMVEYDLAVVNDSIQLSAGHRGSGMTRYNKGSSPPRAQSSTRGSNATQRPIRWSETNAKAPTLKFAPIFAGTIVAALVIFAFAAHKFSWFSEVMKKEPARIFVRIEDDLRVQFAINNQYLFAGKYQNTPMWIEVPSGESTLKMLRTGYEPVVTKINVKSGSKQQTNKIKLQPTTAFVPLKVMLQGNFDRGLMLQLNDGQEEADVARGQKTPTLFKDAPTKRDNRLTVIDPKKGSSLMACDFRLDPGRSALLVMDIVRNVCELR